LTSPQTQPGIGAEPEIGLSAPCELMTAGSAIGTTEKAVLLQHPCSKTNTALSGQTMDIQTGVSVVGFLAH
jgi:hypothetical protein